MADVTGDDDLTRIVGAKKSPWIGSIGEPSTLPVVLSGLLAWAVTVAPAGFARGAPLGAGVLAALSGAAALGGPAVAAVRPRLGRHVGISLFVASSAATWLASSASIHPLRLDPIRGAFGAVAWGVFVLSWSERWSSRPTVPSPDADAPALQARATLPSLAVPIAAIGVVSALTLVALAWHVPDPERALVSHAVAIGCAVAVVTAAAQIATSRGRRRSSSGRRFSAVAVRSLIFLVISAVVGVVILLVR